MIRKVKDEIRILGIDDGPFKKTSKEVLVVGTVFRGGHWIDGVLSARIHKDGKDVTDKIVEMVQKTGHRNQLRVILLNGVTFGGFNIVDMDLLNSRTRMPVIAVVRKNPDFDSIKAALQIFPDAIDKWDLIQRAGKVKLLKVGKDRMYFQHAGIEEAQAKEILKLVSIHASYPEPLRVAHMIAAGVVLGKTRGGK